MLSGCHLPGSEEDALSLSLLGRQHQGLGPRALRGIPVLSLVSLGLAAARLGAGLCSPVARVVEVAVPPAAFSHRVAPKRCPLAAPGHGSGVPLPPGPGGGPGPIGAAPSGKLRHGAGLLRSRDRTERGLPGPPAPSPPPARPAARSQRSRRRFSRRSPGPGGAWSGPGRASVSPAVPRGSRGHGADRAAGAAAGAAAGPGPLGASQRAAHQPGPEARPRGTARAPAGGGTGHRAPLRAAAPRAPHLVRPLRGFHLGGRQEEPPVPP